MNEGLKYALKILGVKDYFTAEIRNKVESRFGAEDAETTIKKLLEYGYLNDERVAKSYISYKLRSGYGVYYIKNKLFQRGYDADIAEIEQVCFSEGINVEELIEKLAEKYKNLKGDADKNFLKCVTFLINRGYPSDFCFKILKKGDFKK